MDNVDVDDFFVQLAGGQITADLLQARLATHVDQVCDEAMSRCKSY